MSELDRPCKRCGRQVTGLWCSCRKSYIPDSATYNGEKMKAPDDYSPEETAYWEGRMEELERIKALSKRVEIVELKDGSMTRTVFKDVIMIEDLTPPPDLEKEK